jgi:hypothetical protein
VNAKVKKVQVSGRHSREECQRLPAKEPTTTVKSVLETYIPEVLFIPKSE